MKLLPAFLCAFFLAFAAAAAAADIRLPADSQLSADENADGKTWRQCGTMSLSYTAAKRNFDLSLRKQGWMKLKTVEYDRVHWKSLELWGKGKERILVQYWREDVSLTGFAWGVLKEEPKKEKKKS